MRWRVAAWSHPLDPDGFYQKEHSVPFHSFEASDNLDGTGRCKLTIPGGAYPWQTLIQAQKPSDPAKTSLLRLYRDNRGLDGQPDAEYKLERFQIRVNEDGENTVDIFGVDWKVAALDAAVLRWWDFEVGAGITRQADWSYGGDDQQNLLENTDIEVSGTPTIQAYHLHAASGFYTLTVPGYGTTANLEPYEAGGRAGDVKDALEAVAGINEVEVSGKGHTEEDPLIVEFLDPIGPVPLMTVNDVSLVMSGCDHPPCHAPVIAKIQQGEYSLDPWTVNKNPDTKAIKPGYHGITNSLTAVDDPIDGPPAKVIEVNPKTSNAGFQQIVPQVEEGYRMNAVVEIDPPNGHDEYRIIIKNWKEETIAKSPWTTGTPDTWNTITIPDFTTPNHLPRHKLVYRIQSADEDGNPGTFYARGMGLFYGVAAATLGTIADEMLNDAQIDHPPITRIPYIVRRAFGWNQIKDTADIPWAREEHIVLRRLQKYGTHLFNGQFADLGYEYDIVPTEDPFDPEWYIDIWDEGHHGTTHDDGIAFIVGYGVSGGLFAGRLPTATRWLAEGADGVITESSSPLQEDETGIYEEGFIDTDALDGTTLLQKAVTYRKKDLDNRIAITFELDGSAPVPYTDFDVGDTAPFQWAGKMDSHNRRITGITLKASPDDEGETAWSASITASKLFIGKGAINEGLYRLLRAYKRPGPDIPPPSDGEGEAVAGEFSVTIACADANDIEIQKADVIAAGASDLEAWDTALALIPEGGIVKISSGDLLLDPDQQITVPEGYTLKLTPATRIIGNASPSTTSGWLVEVCGRLEGEGGQVRNDSGHGARNFCPGGD